MVTSCELAWGRGECGSEKASLGLPNLTCFRCAVALSALNHRGRLGPPPTMKFVVGAVREPPLRMDFHAKGRQPGWSAAGEPGICYSKGSIIFWKTSFFRVPSILWATLPCLSMITVVGTTEMLP